MSYLHVEFFKELKKMLQKEAKAARKESRRDAAKGALVSAMSNLNHAESCEWVLSEIEYYAEKGTWM